MDPGSVLLRQNEIHVELTDHLNRLPIEERRRVHPLFGCINGRLDEQGMTALHLQISDPSLLVDRRHESHRALYARLQGKRRVSWWDLSNDPGLDGTAGDADLRRFRAAWWRRGGRGAPGTLPPALLGPLPLLLGRPF